MLLRVFVVTISCAVLFQSLANALPVNEYDVPGNPAEEVHEHLDVNVDVIGPVYSPLKHLETVQTDKKYVDFINDLYKRDKSKTPLTFEQRV